MFLYIEPVFSLYWQGYLQKSYYGIETFLYIELSLL